MDFFFKSIDGEFFKIQKTYTTLRDGQGNDISGPYWMLIKISVSRNATWWKSDGVKKIPKDGTCFIYLPPYSWTSECYQKNTTLNVVGLISKNEIKSAFTEPILFSSERPFPETRKEVESLLASIDVFEYISKCSKPSSLSLRTKKLLDSHFQDNIEIGRIAIKLKTNPATLSRIFKLDYGYPPAFYKKGLKVTSGMFELMMGTPPAEAALLAGYTDLSRFYKQFKEYLKQTPAQYLEKSKNAKN